MKKFIAAVKENQGSVRTKLLIVMGTVAATLAAGILLNKLNDDMREVIIIDAGSVDEVEASVEKPAKAPKVAKDAK